MQPNTDTQEPSAQHSASVIVLSRLETSAWAPPDHELLAALRAMPGVTSVTLHSDRSELTVTCSSDADPHAIRNKARAFGFDTEPL